MRTRNAAEGTEERRLAKENLRQQNTLRTQGRKSVARALERVREAARKERRKGKLTALLHHVYNIDMLREAYFRLKRQAAAGIDEMTWTQYGEGLEQKLEGLSERLRRGAYRPSAVRRVHIPKPDGGKRPLGITTIEDKVVQMAIVAVLTPIYEQDFVDFSYGFRPERSQHDALDALCLGIERKKVRWVLDADIRGFFDAIDHEWLMKFIAHRIGDQRIGRLIRRFLRAGVLEDGQWRSTDEGTPQGGSISPLLANIFLHYAFDLWAEAWDRRTHSGKMQVVRYADDCAPRRRGREAVMAD
jgi:group II intron reverse transcriptase/maturase